jgi:SUMO ligase MMS21 Smc5/6 complex component
VSARGGSGATCADVSARSECGHTYSRKAVMKYAQTARKRVCPVAGCRARLDVDKLTVDEDMKYALIQHQRTQQSAADNEDYEEL